MKSLLYLLYVLGVLALAAVGLKYPAAANIGVIFGILNFLGYGITLFFAVCILATVPDITQKTDLKGYKRITDISKYQIRFSLSWLSLATLLTFAAGSFFTGFCYLASFLFILICGIIINVVKDAVKEELEKREVANVE